MNPAPSYLIDADVLITAKNSYYAFGICPGFWSSLLHGHSRGHLHSIDRVRQELLRGSRDEDPPPDLRLGDLCLVRLYGRSGG